jgi:hypothetical protein
MSTRFHWLAQHLGPVKEIKLWQSSKDAKATP